MDTVLTSGNLFLRSDNLPPVFRCLRTVALSSSIFLNKEAPLELLLFFMVCVAFIMLGKYSGLLE